MQTLPSIRLLVFPEHAGERLDRFLAAAAGISRRRARSLVDEGRVRVDGRPLRVQSRQVATAQVVDLELPAGEARVEPKTPPPVEIVHRDAALLAAVKPAGVLSQPAERRREGELALDERLALVLARAEGRRPELHLIHRLDRGASGLVLFARTREAAAALSEALREGHIERRYRAVVEGQPDFSHRTVEAAIARDRSVAWRFEVSPRGRPAATEVEVERVGEGWAVVRCRLLTGRTHQVRVHLAHLGHPVRGDRLYGAPAGGAARPLLHAESLSLPHPDGGRPLTLAAPPPDDFAPYL